MKNKCSCGSARFRIVSNSDSARFLVKRHLVCTKCDILIFKGKGKETRANG